ncbi:MAG: 30S ribosomal protein S10, partial [Halobacteria archaeon]
MAQRARIRLSGTSPDKLEEICKQVKQIAERTGVNIHGPV